MTIVCQAGDGPRTSVAVWWRDRAGHGNGEVTRPRVASGSGARAGGGPRGGTVRRVLELQGYEPLGLLSALGLFCLSVTPSLLPRGWLLQGVISGALAAIGYAMGTLAAVLLAKVASWRPRAPRSARGRWLLGVIAGLAVLVFLYRGSAWQRELYRLTGQEPPARYAYAGVLPAAVTVLAVLIRLARLARDWARRVGDLMRSRLPAPLAWSASALTMVIVSAGVVDGAVWDGPLSPTNMLFKTVNHETMPGTIQPTSPALSGSPASLVSWSSLGRQGREFVAGAPAVEDLRRFGAPGASQPVRVYAGVDAAPTIRERAALAVRELERAGGFSRRVLCVITTTGTGWIDAQAVEPLEYMYAGDTALVAMQYTYLPSLISFLADRSASQKAGRELFDQVHARWSTLPQGRRPLLLVFGESLGSFGGEAAFTGVDDIVRRTDGVLWVGPPRSNALRAALTAARDPGTSEVLPVYQQGRTVRFAAVPADLDDPGPHWARPRVVYLQHASDPIVWWSPRLLYERPDWLREPGGRDVPPGMRWYPFLTFWQVTADLVSSTRVPAGHGHVYGSEQVDAWAAIAPPSGWSPTQTARLKALMERLYGR
jgi:uncharacterized membrane protein